MDFERPGSVAPANSHFANLLRRVADRVAPERPGSAPAFRLEFSCGWRQSTPKNGNGIGLSDIDAREIVPHDASTAATFEEQLDRHASVIARYGTEWADRLVEEADRLVERPRPSAAPRSSLPR